MTTIAWDGNTLACDSQMGGEFIDQHGIQKIFKRRGKVIAGAGTYSEIATFVKTGEGLSEETECLVFDNGKVYYHTDTGSFKIGGKTAIGSGCQFAMGAMLAGATSIEAVKIAMKLDTNTGGKVRSVKI